MPQINDQQLAQLAYNAGFRGNDLKIAVAVAKAESNGDPSAYNPEIAAGTPPGSGSRGLWQIYGVAHPQYNSSLAFDPVVNAQAAFQVYTEAGRRFTPWSTFNNGSALQIAQGLQIGQPTKGNVKQAILSGIGVATTSGTTVPAVATLNRTEQAVQDIASGKFITNIFAKVDKPSLGFYAAGVVLILIGLFVLFAKPAAQIVVGASQLALATAK